MLVFYLLGEAMFYLFVILYTCLPTWAAYALFGKFGASIVGSYLLLGILKLKWFDLNGEGDWLMMLSDSRNRRCNEVWVYILLVVLWFTWPIILFSRTKYEKVDEEVFRLVPGQKDAAGYQKTELVKTGKKRKMLSGPKGFSIAEIIFKLQWAGALGVKRK